MLGLCQSTTCVLNKRCQVKITVLILHTSQFAQDLTLPVAVLFPTPSLGRATCAFLKGDKAVFTKFSGPHQLTVWVQRLQQICK